MKPELSFVTLIPELKLSTEMARGLLPKEVPFRHAVENAQRTARIAAAFCTGDYGRCAGCSSIICTSLTGRCSFRVSRKFSARRRRRAHSN